MVGVVWAYEKGKINACGPDGWNCDAFAGGLASGFLSSGSTLVGSTVSNGIAFLQGARWGNGGFRQQLGTHTTEVDGKETTTTMISSRDSIMSLSSNMAGNLVKQIIDNKTGIADGYTFNILNSRDLGFKSDVGLFAVTLGGSKGLSAAISSDGLNISSSMWKDFGEGMKYLNKLNELRGNLHNYDNTDPIYKVYKENYLEFVTEDMMNGDIKIMQMMIDNEKDPAKKEELKKQLENMLNFQGGLQNTIFGTGEGLNIDWTAGEYKNSNGTISLDAANLLNSLRVNAGGNIEFNIEGAAVNTALMGHEWMHDGVSSDKKQATEEEANCVIFQNVILKTLMMKFGTGMLTENVDILKDFLAYTLIEQKGGLGNEEAKELFYKYIQQSHDLSSDLWNLIKKDGKIYAECETGDTFAKLIKEIYESLPAELQIIMDEKIKSDKELWKKLYDGAEKDEKGLTVGHNYDITSFFKTVLGIDAKDINIDNTTQSINVDNSAWDKIKNSVNTAIENGKEALNNVTDMFTDLAEYLNLSKVSKLKKQAKDELEKAKEDEYFKENLEFSDDIDINKVLGAIAKDIIKVLKDVKQNAKDENGKEIKGINSGVMFYENIFVDNDYKENLEKTDTKKRKESPFNPMAHNSLAVAVINGKIAGLGFGSTLPVKASDAYDGSNSAVIANGLYMAKKGTYHGGNCYRFYQTIYATDKQGKAINNNNDYVDAWENNGTAKIPILNSSNPRNPDRNNPYAYAAGILLHKANHSGTESSIYPSKGCITFSNNGKTGLMKWDQLWSLFEGYQYIFIYVNRNYMSDYKSYGF